MISLQARQSIEYIFTQSARKSFQLDPADYCNIELLQGGVQHKHHEKDVIVLTISSFLFRVLTIFHIGEDAETRNYFLNGRAEKSLTEVFSEISNLCSGAMNAELLRYFPHLGMSTPCTLSGRCLPFLSELKSGHMSHFNITINGAARLQATLCMCGYAPVDFALDKTAAAVETGELEFF